MKSPAAAPIAIAVVLAIAALSVVILPADGAPAVGLVIYSTHR